MQKLFFISSLILFNQTAIANQLQFTTKNPQSVVENWDCRCQQQVACSVETIQGQSVITIPKSCSINSSYADEHAAAAHFEVVTLEKPNDLTFITLFSDEGLSKIFKPGIQTIAKSDHHHTVTGYANLKPNKAIIANISNMTDQPLHVMDAVLRTSVTPRSGSLLIAHGGSANATFSSDEDMNGWIPLPLNYETQVPLDVHFNISPKSLVKSIHYEVDDLGNWGAHLQFNSNIPDGTRVHFTWEATVLTNDEQTHYKTPVDSSEWLAPSPIVQANNPAIANTAQSFLDPASKVNTVANMINWLLDNIEMRVDGTLDAEHVFTVHAGTCTGYSNLAAAFARSLNIPTITLAGYSVGSTGQQTHWINQIYLGSEQGWHRFEPQGLLNVEPEYFIPVRINRLSEEIGSNYLFGIATKAFPMLPIDLDRPNNEIVDAEDLREFTDPQEKMNLVFKKAQDEWNKDFKKLLSKGKISEKRQQLRNKMQHAKTLSEVEKLLKQLALN